MSLIIAGLVLLSCGCFLWWIGAIYIPAPKRDFTIEELLLDESDLPPGWAVEERWKDGAEIGETPQPGFKIIGRGSGGEGSEEEVWVDIIFPPYVIANENIKRYVSFSAAHHQFIRLGERVLSDDTWGTVEELSFVSATADEAHLVFGERDEKKGGTTRYDRKGDVVRYWARYQEFVVLFWIDIEYDFASLPDFRQVNEILQKLDRRISCRLYPEEYE